MRLHLSPLLCALLLLTGAAGHAHAQSKPAKTGDEVALPIWNNASGKVEAVLYLEPTGQASSGARWKFGRNTLDAAFGLENGDSLALLCDRKTGISSAIDNLDGNCMLGALGNGLDDNGSKRANFSTSFSRPGGKAVLTLGKGRDLLPAWLTPTGKANAKVEQNDLTFVGQKNIGRNGMVSIAGTTAKARLVPAASVPGFADHWNTKSVSVGGGVGAFSANIVGRVLAVPGRSEKWQGLGLGLTWRTPWSGQLSVGAENVVTRGKNPFSPGTKPADEEDSTIPYVRYEQDL
ncbi:MAG: hypothetical protein WKF61_02375 [Luteimonas sp.]